MQTQNEAGEINIPVPRKGGSPSASKRKERKAQLQLSFGTCRIAPPPEMKDKEAVRVNFVYAVKMNPPKNDKIEWRILTTIPVNSLQDAEQCIHFTSKDVPLMISVEF